jgi:hypothetical protein
MTHRFRVGQKVHLNRRFGLQNTAVGDYQIVRQLPDSAGEFHYRIKNTRETHERVAKESDLEPV